MQATRVATQAAAEVEWNSLVGGLKILYQVEGKQQVDGQKWHDGFSKSGGKETHQLRMVVIHHPMIYGGVFLYIQMVDFSPDFWSNQHVINSMNKFWSE